jgi:hypothetical protein
MCAVCLCTSRDEQTASYLNTLRLHSCSTLSTPTFPCPYSTRPVPPQCPTYACAATKQYSRTEYCQRRCTEETSLRTLDRSDGPAPRVVVQSSILLCASLCVALVCRGVRVAACCVVRVVGWGTCHAPLRVHRCCSFVEQWQLCDGCTSDGRTFVAVCVVADMQRSMQRALP